jgi:uncharacterized membrane protein YhaH (DUF805 family)
MIEWYNSRFANFDGRSTRSEYGYYILFNMVIALIIFLISGMTENKLSLFYNICIFQLVFFVPMQAVTIRRLHDLGLKSYYFVLNVIPGVNFIFSLYLLITEGERGYNLFGSDPKARPQIVEFDFN